MQLDHVQGVPHMEIAWNQIVNEPDRSAVEDTISAYASGGTNALFSIYRDTRPASP